MKIERISENQIRCTLTSEDLASRQIRISELAYGSEKAKNLFRDMMQQAHFELGFEADNIPLMIEAIPSPSGSLVLIITKVDDPEELDNKFSKFAPFSASGIDGADDIHINRVDDILDIFHKIYEAKVKSLKQKKAEKAGDSSQSKESSSADPEQNQKEPVNNDPKEPQVPVDIIRLYEFGTLDGVIDAAFSLNNYYNGINSLYKDERHGFYMLVIHQSQHTPEEFNKVCNVLSEYASGQAYSNASEAYLQEHKDVVIANEAIQRLSQLK